jgi:spermidine synthase
VLVVGCGAGVTAGSFVTHPGVERIVICEIEPLIPRVVARFFGPENHNVLEDPRVTVVYDDARHYLLTTRETFDVITSDPIHPWVKGAAALYTREYFDLCKRRLNPGGVVSQWVPLYETTGEAVRSELATFLAAFPEGTVWGNTINEAGYDTVLLGGKGKIRFSGVELQRRLDRADHRAVARSLAEVEFTSAASLLATYAGGAADLRPWLAGASINRDRDLRLQYLAGMGLNLQRSDEIYAALVKRRAFPKAFFAPAPKR